MKLLDLFCGGGGAGMGYSRAGFTVVGVDIKPQPHYPFEFHQADALEYLAEHYRSFDLIHASPPCQRYSMLGSLHGKRDSYPDLLLPTVAALKKTGKPYVVENVPGAPMKNYLMLCGSMFGLRVYRHRLFECNPPLYFAPMSCNHWGKASGNKSMKAEKRATPNLVDFEIMTITGHDFILSHAREAMGIDWMNQAEISQAIPPVYTEWLGKQMIERL